MKNRSENILKTKSFEFALKIIHTYKKIVIQHKEYVLSRQVLKSGTSIGAMVRESELTQSKADFISKLSIALTEANETEYWLSLLNKSRYISQKVFENLLSENDELVNMLVASVRTAKKPLHSL